MVVSVGRIVGWAINVSTPAQQQRYTQLSGLLHAFGIRYQNELPSGATSLLMKVINGNVSVEVYDGLGKIIGAVPNQETSAAFRTHLQQLFGHTVSPDPDGVVVALI
jgi:hypothetical protein